MLAPLHFPCATSVEMPGFIFSCDDDRSTGEMLSQVMEEGRVLCTDARFFDEKWDSDVPWKMGTSMRMVPIFIDGVVTPASLGMRMTEESLHLTTLKDLLMLFERYGDVLLKQFSYFPSGMSRIFDGVPHVPHLKMIKKTTILTLERLPRVCDESRIFFGKHAW